MNYPKVKLSWSVTASETVKPTNISTFAFILLVETINKYSNNNIILSCLYKEQTPRVLSIVVTRSVGINDPVIFFYRVEIASKPTRWLGKQPSYTNYGASRLPSPRRTAWCGESVHFDNTGNFECTHKGCFYSQRARTGRQPSFFRARFNTRVLLRRFAVKGFFHGAFYVVAVRRSVRLFRVFVCF